MACFIRLGLRIDGRDDVPDLLTPAFGEEMVARPELDIWVDVPTWYRMRIHVNDNQRFCDGVLLSGSRADFWVREDGLTWVLFFNARPEDNFHYWNQVVSKVNIEVGKIEWPEEDLFGGYP